MKFVRAGKAIYSAIFDATRAINTANIEDSCSLKSKKHPTTVQSVDVLPLTKRQV